MEKENIRVMARNREAYHEYFVEETYECGLSLMGTEVKSMRQGKVNLKDASLILKRANGNKDPCPAEK